MNSIFINQILPYIFVGLFLLYPVSTHSETRRPLTFVDINNSTGNYVLGTSIKYLEDKKGLLTINDIMSVDVENKFVQNNTQIPNFGFSKSTYWLMGGLKYTGKNLKKTVLLEIAYPHLDFIEFYFYDENGRIKKKTTGDQFSFSQRDVLNHTFVFKFDINHQPKKFYIKIITESSVQVPLILWLQSSFTEHLIGEKFFYGIYFGTFIIMIGYNLFLFITIRDINIVYYLLVISNYLLFQASLSGYGFQFVWNEYPWWANKSLPFFITVTTTFGYLFSKQFLNTRQYLPIIDKVITFFIFVGVILLFITFHLGYATIIKLSTSYALLWSIILLTTGIMSVYRKNSTARFYLIAWIVLLSGVFIYTLKTFGMLPVNFITDHGIHFGSVNLLMLLSIAMVDKINIERKQTEIKQQKALNTSSNLLETQTKIHDTQETIAQTIQNNAVTVLDVSKNLLQDITLLSEQSDNVANTSLQISDSIIQISSAIKNMTLTVDQILMKARNLFTTMDTVFQSINIMSETMDIIETSTKNDETIAKEATQLSEKTKQTMSDLESAAGKIYNVTDLIKHISDKTNLLSLNAAIEAASAGEAGKGFSIVARFIQTFAESSASAANDIGQSIHDIENKKNVAINVLMDITSIIQSIHESFETIFESIEEHVKTAHTIATNAVTARLTSEKILSQIGALANEVQLISKNVDNIKDGVNKVAMLTGKVSVQMNDNKQSIALIGRAFKGLSELSNKMIIEGRNKV
jgi:methyl-accepting chemotaxis protein